MSTYLDGALWEAGKLLDSISGEACQFSQGRPWQPTEPQKGIGIHTQQNLQESAQDSGYFRFRVRQRPFEAQGAD